MLGEKVHRCVVQQPAGVKLGHHSPQKIIEGFIINLAFVFTDDIALGIDEDEGGPSTAGVLLPNMKVRVVGHGGFKLIALDRI